MEVLSEVDPEDSGAMIKVLGVKPIIVQRLHCSMKKVVCHTGLLKRAESERLMLETEHATSLNSFPM